MATGTTMGKRGTMNTSLIRLHIAQVYGRSAEGERPLPRGHQQDQTTSFLSVPTAREGSTKKTIQEQGVRRLDATLRQSRHADHPLRSPGRPRPLRSPARHTAILMNRSSPLVDIPPQVIPLYRHQPSMNHEVKARRQCCSPPKRMQAGAGHNQD